MCVCVYIYIYIYMYTYKYTYIHCIYTHYTCSLQVQELRGRRERRGGAEVRGRGFATLARDSDGDSDS